MCQTGQLLGFRAFGPPAQELAADCEQYADAKAGNLEARVRFKRCEWFVRGYVAGYLTGGGQYAACILEKQNAQDNVSSFLAMIDLAEEMSGLTIPAKARAGVVLSDALRRV